MKKIVVDWVACDGHGLCAQMAPELIDLDDWGFPIITHQPEDQRSNLLAQSAVEACPVLALRLERVD
ncbi:MAG TPA: ferredoxin [Actinobacteria bacterium]|nr:ferredoxin [Actinomycetota bacterium]HCK79794.1 ferredoxin [Actinomycetota bacterium]